MSEQDDDSGSAFHAIQSIDYTVVFVRNMEAMKRFYEGILRFKLTRELSPDWLEYRIGSNTLTLAKPRLVPDDVPTSEGSASLQLAFKVSRDQVDQCADELIQAGVNLLSPPADRDFGHRTLFFRDPDGNVLEIYAEI